MAIFEYLVKSAGMTKQALSPKLLSRAVQALEKAGPERIINKVTGRFKVPVDSEGKFGYAPVLTSYGSNVGKNTYAAGFDSTHAASNLPRLEALRRMTKKMQDGARTWSNIANNKPFSLGYSELTPYIHQGHVAFGLDSYPVRTSRSAATYVNELLKGYKPDVSNSMSKILTDRALTPEARKFVAAQYNFVPNLKVGMPYGLGFDLPRVPDVGFKWRE